MPIETTFAPQTFADRAVLVTGGTSGIGLGCARACRDLGATVVATGATEAECSRAAAEPGNESLAFRVLDVRDGAAIDATIAGLERLDILVTAAGVIRRDDEHDPEVFADVLAINLTGTMRVCASARPPGWIVTPLTQALQQDPERSRPILSRTPMGRWGTPEEVAAAVVFLASPAARFVNGAILPVDGGYLTL